MSVSDDKLVSSGLGIEQGPSPEQELILCVTSEIEKTSPLVAFLFLLNASINIDIFANPGLLPALVRVYALCHENVGTLDTLHLSKKNYEEIKRFFIRYSDNYYASSSKPEIASKVLLVLHRFLKDLEMSEAKHEGQGGTYPQRRRSPDHHSRHIPDRSRSRRHSSRHSPGPSLHHRSSRRRSPSHSPHRRSSRRHSHSHSHSPRGRSRHHSRRRGPGHSPHTRSLSSRGQRLTFPFRINEKTSINLDKRLERYGYRKLVARGDGNCQFRAMSDQVYGTQKLHAIMRWLIVGQILYNPYLYRDLLDGQDVFTYVEFISKLKNWGDFVTLQACADLYQTHFVVMTSRLHRVSFEVAPQGVTSLSKATKVASLGYINNQHYDSIYRKEVYEGEFMVGKREERARLAAGGVENLEENLSLQEEVTNYDDKMLGKELEQLLFYPPRSGNSLFHHHGDEIAEKLIAFIRKEYCKRDYLEGTTLDPNNMQTNVRDIGEEDFYVGVKPMNCQQHCAKYGEKIRSYTELPLRMADLGVLHCTEAAGELTALTRVERFHKDDAHIFCRVSQIKDEVKNVLEIISYTCDIFGFTYILKLTTRSEDKHPGDTETWDKALKALKDALNEVGKPWQTNEAAGAFHGAKVDISVSYAMNREFSCAILQLDLELPQELNLKYLLEDETKHGSPVMIHTSIVGFVERMVAKLSEHYNGKWPFWLSPRQAIVFLESDKTQAYGQQVKDEIVKAGYNVDITVAKEKVPEAQLSQYNYILFVGEEEATTKKVRVQMRDNSEHSVKTIPDLLQQFKEEVVQDFSLAIADGS